MENGQVEAVTALSKGTLQETKRGESRKHSIVFPACTTETILKRLRG